jgi:hypothetical protein
MKRQEAGMEHGIEAWKKAEKEAGKGGRELDREGSAGMRQVGEDDKVPVLYESREGNEGKTNFGDGRE